MNGFAKLTRETWKFYLSVLAVFLVCVISNSLYLCKEMNFQYKADNSSFYPDGKVFSDLIVDKATDYDLLGFFTIITGIIIVLGIRHFSFAEQRGKEFQAFLPVKQRTIVMHDFFCMTGIIVLSFLTMTGIFLSAQTKYNKEMSESARIHHIEGMKDNLVSLANKELIKYILWYFLFVFFVFTLIYLGMIVCKNCIAGMLITVCIWRLSVSFLDEVYWLAGNYYSDNLGISTLAAEQKGLLQIAGNLQRAIDPYNFFRKYPENPNLGNTCIWFTIGFTVLLLLLIVVLADRIEISKGKLFYFTFLNYLFPIICGVAIGYYFIYYSIMESILLAVVIGGLAAIFIWRIIYPGKQRVINEWEVK